MEKLEHIGIAVKSLANSEQIFKDILGVSSYKVEEVASESVNTMFFKVGDTKIELLEATSENSAIAKFIEKRGEGIHHLAFEVTDIQKKIDELLAKDYKMIHELPKNGADNKRIAFMHPKSSNGVLVELCEEKS